MKRLFKTLIWILAYCFVWELVEVIIDGHVTNRLVDNIIIILFIPMIYKAMKSEQLK